MRNFLIAAFFLLCIAGTAAAFEQKGDVLSMHVGSSENPMVAQVTPQPVTPQERDILEPDPVPPEQATPEELGLTERTPEAPAMTPEAVPGAEVAPGPVISCGPGEIRYEQGCIPTPSGPGGPLGPEGMCASGSFEYNGRCYPKPLEGDVRMPGDIEQGVSSKKKQRIERQCRDAFEICMQQCEPHKQHKSMYEQCSDACNSSYTTCMQP